MDDGDYHTVEEVTGRSVIRLVETLEKEGVLSDAQHDEILEPLHEFVDQSDHELLKE